MKIQPVYNENDTYEFKINDTIILEIGGTAMPVLKIDLPPSIFIEESYKSIIEQFDIEKMVNDLSNKYDKINSIIIDSEHFRVDGKKDFETSNLKKYKKEKANSIVK